MFTYLILYLKKFFKKKIMKIEMCFESFIKEFRLDSR